MNTKTETILNTPIEELTSLNKAHDYLITIQRASWENPTEPRWRITSLFASGYTVQHIAEVTEIPHDRITAAINHTHKGVNVEKILRATDTTSRNRLVRRTNEDIIESVKWWCSIDPNNRSSHKYNLEYAALGLPSSATLYNKFGSWATVMEKAGYQAPYTKKPKNTATKELSSVREYVNHCRKTPLSGNGYKCWCESNGYGDGNKLIKQYGGWDNLLIAAFSDQ